ncbi:MULTISPECIES: CopZ family metallochaperone [Deinococcus]|uniref:Copper chaperone n=1 Tax=Deinococcus cavernae TaxID=2320857 RepID=A0A418V895_9DEIO|nr:MULTISPECIES: cation transporter [Deinococcus]RJF72325.1 copper chaperone [Deinococcus cavernae]
MKTELNITGMSCGHCVSAVEKALKTVPGVQDVQVTLQPGKAVVEGSASQQDMIAAVVEEGYKAEVAGA